jgi:DNA-directed RNA polymerase specialized sigma24 family protein
LSGIVAAALPDAEDLLEETVLRLLGAAEADPV